MINKRWDNALKIVVLILFLMAGRVGAHLVFQSGMLVLIYLKLKS